EERVGRLQHRDLGQAGAALLEQSEDVGGEGGQTGGHASALLSAFCASSTRRTASTSPLSGAVNCAGRLSRQVALSSISADSFAPRARSLICTSPLARSSPPWMTTQGAPRRSAYFICAFMPAPPRYISALMPATRNSETIFW